MNISVAKLLELTKKERGIDLPPCRSDRKGKWRDSRLEGNIRIV